jgi:hypothetical protein
MSRRLIAAVFAGEKPRTVAYVSYLESGQATALVWH